LEEKKVLCYHHNDGDGRMAATVVASVYPEAEFKEVNYGIPADPNDYKARKVIIVDFSFPKETMEDIKKESKWLCWIDHHETAKKNMNELWESDEIDGLREIGKCGAILAWKWFRIHEDIPLSIELTNDYDLWLHKMKDTKYFAERVNLFEKPFNPNKWQGLLKGMTQDYIDEGKLLYEAKLQRCNDAIERGREMPFTVKRTEGGPDSITNAFYVNAYPIDFALTGTLINDKGHELAVVYCQKGDETLVGLRSMTLDVSKLAEGYGGGGHKHAAGFRIKRIGEVKGGD